MFYLVREVGKIWGCSCREKGNFIMVHELKYGHLMETSENSIFTQILQEHFSILLLSSIFQNFLWYINIHL